MSIDFRTQCFNVAIKRAINDIYDKAHKTEPFDSDDLFKKLNQDLEDYYWFEYRERKGYEKRDAEIRAKEVLSEFLQHLMYYLYHNVKNNIYVQALSTQLINHPDFLYESKFNKNSPKVMVWIDPKEGYAALNSLAKE